MIKFWDKGFKERAWAKEALEKVYLTPDNAQLEEHDFMLFFIYDEMKQELSKNNLLNVAAKLVSSVYTRQGFQLWQMRVPGQVDTFKPFALPSPHFSTKGNSGTHIRGELWLVPTEHIRALDLYKGNMLYFKRRRERIIIPYRHLMKSPYSKGQPYILSNYMYHLVKAWMYVGIPEFWEKQIDAGFIYSKLDHVPVDRDETVKLKNLRTYAQFRTDNNLFAA